MLKFRFLTYTNFGLIEKWYEDMAKRGYQIEKIPLTFVHKIKKTEPADIKYKISIAPNETWHVKFSKEELADYDQMTDDYGWHLVDRIFNMNLYEVHEEGADSLYDDDSYEIEILNKSIKGEIISLSLTTLIFAFLAFSNIAKLRSSEIYYSNFPIFMGPACIFLIIFSILSLVDYISFKRRNKNTKAMKDLIFTKLEIGKLMAILTILSIIFVILAWVTGIFSLIGNAYGNIALLALFPTFLIGFIVYYFIKKVKGMDVKKSKKNFLFVFIPFILFIVTSASTLGIVGKFAGKIDNQAKDFGEFSVIKEPTSFLAQNCQNFWTKSYGLNIRKTLVKSETLAEDLFDRILQNAKDHPYRAEFVKNISKDFTYDKTYSLADYDSYLILQGDTVLEVDGNIYDDKVAKDIEKILEAK